MDKLTNYRQLIKKLLTHYVEISQRQPSPGVEELLIADDASGHYFWLNLGWTKGERINATTIHLRLKDGKIWIEENWTDFDIADELIAAGVPKTDIVLALHAPEMRQYAEFAAA